ncbi:MAG TPA: Mut7-C RNAse domain-containing protein [Woeseiaceae bacterium]|jgi:uncharacterized protein with PIN domain|nr:Mut7-C RNAse domain-containing protein [Woeseiaceae bacterium]
MQPERHPKPRNAAEFRFYAELNDFLPAEERQVAFHHSFEGTPSVKDTIEAIGIPHTEIDVILVNDRSVDFTYRLRGGERVSVYPVFERFDIADVTRLRPAPLRITSFVADVHLGTLARYLRLLGFDTTWERDLSDENIVERSAREERIILTRDRAILRHGRVTHGYWLRAIDPLRQLDEVVRALHLQRAIRPYTRCMECNGVLRDAAPAEVAGDVPRRVLELHREFSKCDGCARVYWAGSHRKRLDAVVRRIRAG